MVDTISTLSAEAQTFVDRNLLYRAREHQPFYQLGQKRPIGKRGGNQVSYRRFNALSLATTALTEGVTPTADSLSVTEVTGTVAQYGNYVEISDHLDMVGVDPVLVEATDVLGQTAASLLKR